MGISKELHSIANPRKAKLGTVRNKFSTDSLEEAARIGWFGKRKGANNAPISSASSTKSSLQWPSTAPGPPSSGPCPAGILQRD